MRILISSKYLFYELRKWNFTKSHVHTASLIARELTLSGDDQVLVLYVEPIKISAILNTINQDDRNWNDIRDLVRNVPEQPIVLEISRTVNRVIFEF